jgi:hypothetical protein
MPWSGLPTDAGEAHALLHKSLEAGGRVLGLEWGPINGPLGGPDDPRRRNAHNLVRGLHDELAAMDEKEEGGGAAVLSEETREQLVGKLDAADVLMRAAEHTRKGKSGGGKSLSLSLLFVFSLSQ